MGLISMKGIYRMMNNYGKQLSDVSSSRELVRKIKLPVSVYARCELTFRKPTKWHYGR